MTVNHTSYHILLYMHEFQSIFNSVVMVEWQLPGYIINEEVVSVNVCAVLSQPAERNVNVMITTASGTATGTNNLMPCIMFSESFIHVFLSPRRFGF